MNDIAALLRRIGRRVGELRRTRDLTQEQVAERLDVSVTYVASVEGGKRNVSVRTMGAFADVLGVRVEQFFETPTEPAPRPGRPRRRRG